MMNKKRRSNQEDMLIHIYLSEELKVCCCFMKFAQLWVRAVPRRPWSAILGLPLSQPLLLAFSFGVCITALRPNLSMSSSGKAL